jgi:hypothetical protein
MKTGSVETKAKTETDCTEAEDETKTDMPETKTETETSRAETGRHVDMSTCLGTAPRVYVFSRPDRPHPHLYIQKI